MIIISDDSMTDSSSVTGISLTSTKQKLPETPDMPSPISKPILKQMKPSYKESQSDTETEGDTSTSELNTTQESIEEKLFRCSSCRRTAKTREEIVEHQQEKVHRLGRYLLHCST